MTTRRTQDEHEDALAAAFRDDEPLRGDELRPGINAPLRPLPQGRGPEYQAKYDEGYLLGMRFEKERARAIFESPAAITRKKLALRLYTDTNLEPAAIIGILESCPEDATPAPSTFANPFTSYMAGLGNPKVGVDASADEAAERLAGEIAASAKNREH